MRAGFVTFILKAADQESVMLLCLLYEDLLSQISVLFSYITYNINLSFLGKFITLLKHFRAETTDRTIH